MDEMIINLPLEYSWFITGFMGACVFFAIYLGSRHDSSEPSFPDNKYPEKHTEALILLLVIISGLALYLGIKP